jgi:hypothetical protein
MMYRRAYDILKQMPAVFDVKLLGHFLRCKRNQAYVYAHRFAKQGLIEAAGKRAAIYYNLVVDPHASVNRKEDVVRMIFPSATIGSLTVLHNSGVITQIPHDLHIMVLSRRSYPEIDGIVLHPRSERWFFKMNDARFIEPAMRQTPTAPLTLQSMVPEAALADALKYKDGWVNDVSDTDLHGLCKDKLETAFDCLRVPKSVSEAFVDLLAEDEEYDLVRFT